MRINRAALDVKWSPDGKKFAVASGAKCVPVCHYEDDNDWWISKMVKKHKSTVLSVDWHPSSQMIVTGCCDFKCRIFSAFIHDLDEPNPSGLFGDLSDTFGELLAEFDASHGWVNAATWSPNGLRVAFAGQDSSISFVHFYAEEDEAGETVINEEEPTVQTIKLETLPFHKLLFSDDDRLIAVGHEFNPNEFCCESDMWSLSRKLDDESKAGAASPEKKTSSFSAARNMFGKSAAKKGGSSRTAAKISTKHKACITGISSVSDVDQAVTRFVTAGIDGQIRFWEV